MKTLLVIGSPSDPAIPRVREALRDHGCTVAFVDEDRPDEYRVHCEHRPGTPPEFQISGPDCRTDRPVDAIFLRHAVARTLDPRQLRALGELQANLNRLLHFAECPRMNPPSAAYSTYSKPQQFRRLAQAGFEIPRTLVTNEIAEASHFLESCGGRVLFKAASQVMTRCQVIRPEDLERLALLPYCPTLFQEHVQGVDIRVHVAGETTIACALPDDDARPIANLLSAGGPLETHPVALAPDLATRCVEFCRQLGLSLCGLDFRRREDGRMIALDANPFPRFTQYEGAAEPSVTRAIVEFLTSASTAPSRVFA